ncbi:DUF4116 domain-containing protein [Candidatus Pelagibacter sp.]|nr:DUF4116 domain-containing protein [Candidatus Pelagibacter sp.]
MDKKEALKIVKKDGCELENLPDKFKKDKEVVLEAVKQIRKKGNSYKSISEKVTKATRKKFPQSWVFNILKRESTIPPNEEIIRHNICNVELQSNICDV